VNGDGYLDVIVGAPGFDAGTGGSRGKAFVYYGSAAGPSSAPGWEVVGEKDGSAFGFAVASAGDVNGDGFDDVIVGAPFFYQGPTTDVGRIYVFLGSAGGLSTVPAFTAEGQGKWFGHVAGLGYAVASGDFNGDGYSDIAASEVGRLSGYVKVFYGSARGPLRDGAWYGDSGGSFSGRTISTGDLNGDGYDDVIITPLAYSSEGYPWSSSISFGSPRGLPRGPDPAPPRGLRLPLTATVTRLGDVDGDGHVDLLALHFRGYPEDFSPVHVLYRGSASGPRSQGEELGPAFQTDGLLFALGDLNGDGFADAIALDGSLFYVYFGSRSGFSPFSDGIGPAPGTTMAALPDVNGDGFSDLLVGDAANDRVDIYRGGADWSFSSNADVAVGVCLECDINAPVILGAANMGPDTVRLRLVDIIPPWFSGFELTCAWSFAGAVSTQCPPFPPSFQSGDVDVMITLAPGGGIVYWGYPQVTALPIVDTASLTLPGWVTDPDLSNNHAIAVYAPPPIETIFFDRFDSGDLSAWSSHTGGVSVVPEPAREANYVLRATAPHTGDAVVRDETPANESDYHARFVLDPKGFGRSTKPHIARRRDYRAVVFSGHSDASASPLFELRLEATNDGLLFRGLALQNDGSVRETAGVPLAEAPHMVEVSWHRCSAPLANDGQLQIRLDGADAGGLPDMDNDAVGGIDSVALGLDTSPRGIPPIVGHTVRLDDFESWRLLPGASARR
jgi:hypothetical protein